MKHNRITRRQALKVSAGSLLAMPFVLTSRAQAAPAATVHEITVISHQPDKYHGWPTIARRANGQLLVSCSGGREGHVCPFGRVELITSDDDGKTWSDARVLMDCEIDDRDSGVIETAKGSILVTTFTSLAYVPGLEKAVKIKPGTKGAWPQEKLDRWLAVHNQLSEAERKAMLGVWMLRSTDGGKTFSDPYRCLVNSPHGPNQLADGRILYAGKNLWEPETWVGVCQSTDDGQTWTRLAAIPSREGDSLDHYHELHAVEAADGRLIAQIRNHNKTNNRETLQSESEDGGKTWSVPHSIGVWGPAVAPDASGRRSPADDLWVSPTTVRQPGPRFRRQRTHLVGADHHLGRRTGRRPGLSLHRSTARRHSGHRLVRVDGRRAQGRPPPSEVEP